MSNANFDLLDKQHRLAQSKEILQGWITARAKDGLTAEEMSFLDRAIENGKKVVQERKEALRKMHT